MLNLRLLVKYHELKPAALSDPKGLEGTCDEYADAIKCLNLLSQTSEERPLTPEELKYWEACILYMYDIIDTLLNRLVHAETERFEK